MTVLFLIKKWLPQRGRQTDPPVGPSNETALPSKRMCHRLGCRDRTVRSPQPHGHRKLTVRYLGLIQSSPSLIEPFSGNRSTKMCRSLGGVVRALLIAGSVWLVSQAETCGERTVIRRRIALCVAAIPSRLGMPPSHSLPEAGHFDSREDHHERAHSV